MERTYERDALKLHYIDTLHTGDMPFYRPPHQHPDHLELLWIVGGRGRFAVDGRTYDAGPRSLVVYNQGVWHEETALEPITFLFLGVSGYTVPGLPRGAFLDPRQPCVMPLGEKFEPLVARFRELEERFRAQPDDPFGIGAALTTVLLGEIASLLHAPPTPRISSPSAVVSGIKRYLEEHYYEEFSLDRLSGLFYLNKYYIVRLFGKEIGVSPYRFVMLYRMDAAKYYLRTTDDSLEAIAERVGYQSATHFQNVFKRVTGHTPGRYRAQARGQS